MWQINCNGKINLPLPKKEQLNFTDAVGIHLTLNEGETAAM